MEVKHSKPRTNASNEIDFPFSFSTALKLVHPGVAQSRVCKPQIVLPLLKQKHTDIKND